MLLASHVFRATGKNPGSIVIVDRAIKALQGYVDKGHMSQSFFKKLYESYIGSKTGKGGSKKPSAAQRQRGTEPPAAAWSTTTSSWATG